MGTSPVICVGRCRGKTVSIEEAVAGLSSKVSSGLKAKYGEREAQAAAGNKPSLSECLGAKSAERSPCDQQKACDALKEIDQLIGKYQGKAGYLLGSFVEFNQKLGPLLQKTSDALACRFDQGHNAADSAILNDYVGQMLKDRNSFKTASGSSAVPQEATACRGGVIGITQGAPCDDFNAIDRIRSNAATLASRIGCVGPPKDVPPAKKDCKELSNGLLDGMTTFFDELDKLKPKKQIGTGDAYDQVADGVESALQELEAAAKEIEGTGGTASQQYKDVQGKIGQLKKLLGVWSKMKAASCLPPEVEQLLRRLATEKRAGTEHGGTCTELCGKTADWYVKITGLANQRQTFFKACAAPCL
jgi:hypothetical protein